MPKDNSKIKLLLRPFPKVKLVRGAGGESWSADFPTDSPHQLEATCVLVGIEHGGGAWQRPAGIPFSVGNRKRNT